MNQVTIGRGNFAGASLEGRPPGILDQAGLRGMWSPPLILGLLLVTDALFILLHITQMTMGYPRSTHWALEVDRGLAETFQHIKLLWVVVMLVVMSVAIRDWRFIPWGILFGVILLDDHMILHEKMGGKLKPGWMEGSMPLNLRSRDLGELVAFALFGLPPLGLILVGYFTGGPGSQQLQRTLGIFLACLIFFGAGVDLLHQMASESRFNRWVGTLEDGGEMVVVSLLVAFLFNRLRAPTQGDPLAAA